MFEQAVHTHTHSHTLGVSTNKSSSSPHLETVKTLNNPGRASHDSAAALWALGRRRSPAQPNAPDRATFSLAGGALSPEHCTAATILAQRQNSSSWNGAATSADGSRAHATALDTGTQSGQQVDRLSSSAPHTRLRFTRTRTQPHARTHTQHNKAPGQGVGRRSGDVLAAGSSDRRRGAVSSRTSSTTGGGEDDGHLLRTLAAPNGCRGQR